MSKNILNKNMSNFSKKKKTQSLDGVYETDIEQLSSFIFISKNETLKVVLKHCGCGIKWKHHQFHHQRKGFRDYPFFCLFMKMEGGKTFNSGYSRDVIVKSNRSCFFEASAASKKVTFTSQLMQKMTKQELFSKYYIPVCNKVCILSQNWLP